MAEKTKADVYLTYLDEILAGKKDIEPVEDAEIEKLLLLAKAMIAADIGINSKIRETLRKQLLDQLTKKSKSSLSMILRNDDELDDEDLKYVAAGFGKAGEQKEICPYCGARSKNLEGRCPFCGH